MSECSSTASTIGWVGYHCPESRNGAHFCAEDASHRCMHKCPCGVQWGDRLPPTTGETP